jgi:hypothetical protein
MDVFHRLLGTTDITAAQFGWALLPAIALLVCWEIGKLVARRRIAAESSRVRQRRSVSALSAGGSRPRGVTDPGGAALTRLGRQGRGT